MKPTFYTLLFLFLVVDLLNAQDEEFLWAKSYTVSNCIEVGGLAVDTSDNIIIAGVHDAPFSIPFKGDVYIKKTDPDGNILWQKNIQGEITVADMIAVNEDIIITGQAYGVITYDGVEYGGEPYYLYVFRIDPDGNVISFYLDEDKLGFYNNLSTGKDDGVILHARTQSNQGDWILVFDESGNIIQSRLLHPTITLIDDIAYYQGNFYLSGDLNGFSSVTIDTVFIPQSPLESTAFVLSLDSTLTAKWVSLDTTLNNSNGNVKVNENGVFVFQENLDPPFTINSYLKNFDYEGNKIKEILITGFSAGAALLPDMAIAGDRIALFMKNSFSFDSYKVLIYNENLELVNEKVVSGNTDQYSNHIHEQDKNFIISHVYESTLNLNDELTLPYEGPGKQPYVAKVGLEEVISFSVEQDEYDIKLYPNPAENLLNVNLPNVIGTLMMSIVDLSGKVIIEQSLATGINKIDIQSIPAGIYFINLLGSEIGFHSQKLIIR